MHKQMQVYTSIKNIVQDLKKVKGFRNESEVVGYLYAIYENHYPNITLPEEEKAKNRMKEIVNQQSM